MSIIRAPRPEADYVTIRNDVLRDDRLSYRARGILAVILSRPDNWRTDAASLCRSGQEGRDAIRSALRELEGAGYITRERMQDERGRWRTVALVYDTPQPVQQTLSLDAKQDGYPTPGKPAPGKPAVGGPGPIRTTEKNDREEELLPTAADGDGKPQSVAAIYAKEATHLVMDRRGDQLIDARTVNAVARRYRQLAGSQAAGPEMFAQAFLRCRAQGITKPNAERVAEAIANRRPVDRQRAERDAMFATWDVNAERIDNGNIVPLKGITG